MRSRDHGYRRRAPVGRVPQVRRFVATSFILLAVAGCSWGGGEEPPPPDTVARLTLIAMDDVNPNVAGTPSPIVVAYYELTERQAFEGAEFNQLFYDDGSALGNDVKERLEFRVEPGQILRTRRVLDPETRHLGFVAGYRAIEGAQWRLIADVEPATARDHTVVVGAGSLSLAAAPGDGAERSVAGGASTEEESSGVLGGLADLIKGVADAVLPGSE